MTDWNSIVTLEGPAVWRSLWRLLGDETDVDECFQETFVAALQVSRRETVKSWPALLCRLATTRAMDCLRKRYLHARKRHKIDAVQQDDSIPDPLSAVESPSAGPYDQAVLGELTERLRAALTRLPEKQAEIFSLHTLDGWSRPEIAARMMMTDNAVGVALHRARLLLRELLSDTSDSAFTPSRSLPEGGTQ